MAEAEETPESEEEPKKKSKKPLLIGLVLAILGGGGGFYAVFSGMILAPEKKEEVETTEVVPDALPDVVFLPIPPLTISLGNEVSRTHLRFNAQLEVLTAYEPDVAKIMPRVSDVLNGYLRAVEVAELENPAALIELRAQMLRRIQIVTGEGRVRDLLIMEFVLN